MVKYAISEDYLSKDPFILYKAKRVKKTVVFLTPEQLKKLEETELASKIKKMGKAILLKKKYVLPRFCQDQ